MDKGSGRSNRGRGRFGRSHGSSEFRTEKGLIDSLPYLRYRYGSPVVSPHKVQEFLQAIKNYTLQHYSKGLHKSFELGSGSYEDQKNQKLMLVPLKYKNGKNVIKLFFSNVL